MIDKLDVRVPAAVPFTRELKYLFDVELKLRASRHYKLVADLREYGYDAVLHYLCKHGKEKNHKLELIDTGLLAYADMLATIQQLFEVNAVGLSIMRLDLAVDVNGVPVSWFHSRTRVRLKRWLADFGDFKVVEMGNRMLQTLYYGKRPNLIRIYDKLAEWRKEYEKLLRDPSDLLVPSFDKLFDIPPGTRILTRVERQMGGGRIPSLLATVGDLPRCVDMNPFESLEFISGGLPEPDPNQYPFTEYCAGMFLRRMAEEEGMQAVMNFIKKQSNRNVRWALEKFADFLPAPEDNEFDAGRLDRLYRESAAKQFR